MKGLLVTFEGQDGSGKSTLLRFTAKLLAEQNIVSLVVPEFSTNVIGEFLKHILEENKFLRLNTESASAFTETMYVISDLYSQDEIEIRPALRQGIVVIKERHIDSILACQIPKIIDDYPTIDLEQIFQWLMQTSIHLTRPDLTFFLHVNEELLKERIRGRGEQISAKDLAVFRKRQAIYDRLATENQNRWISIENNGVLSEAGLIVVNCILSRLCL